MQQHSGSAADTRTAIPPSPGAYVVISVLAAVVLSMASGFAGRPAGDAWGWLLAAFEAPSLRLEGLTDGAVIGGPDFAKTPGVLRTETPERLAQATVALDGQPLQAGFGGDGSVRVPLDGLADGPHVLAVTQQPSLLLPEVDRRWTFTVDTQPPELELAPVEVAVGDEPLAVSGRTTKRATVTINGEPAPTDAAGTFTARVNGSQAESIRARATDPVGNVASVQTATAWVPSRSDVEQINGVHMSIWGWSSSQLREPVLAMAEQGRINTVQLDLKAEGGRIGYDSDVALANEIGADLQAWDLKQAVEQLHARGVRVVGRIVAFRDPVLAEHAWQQGRRDMVVQRPRGTMYTGSYSGFTSFAHRDVRQYLFALAEEAVRAGVDDILWDYVRRPDGPVEEYHFGLDQDTAPKEAVVEFLAEADDVISRYGASHGASVYGIAATRPTQIAQDIPAMARHLDYVSPMVYYSHWGPGEYGVSDPNTEPYAITRRSLQDFIDAVDGRRARVVPWLQDFQLGGPHGEPQVRAQLRAVADAGIDEWIMWDPSVTYTTSAYDPRR
jgi:hypothetical protein